MSNAWRNNRQIFTLQIMLWAFVAYSGKVIIEKFRGGRSLWNKIWVLGQLAALEKKGLGRLWATFEGGFFMFSGAKKNVKNIKASSEKNCIKLNYFFYRLRNIFNCVFPNRDFSPRDLYIMILIDKEHYCCRVCGLITTSFHEFHILNCILDFWKISLAIEIVLTKKKQLNKQNSFYSYSFKFEISYRKMREIMWCVLYWF